MRDDDLRESGNVEDRRGMGGVATGGLGLGAVVALSLLGWALGINPAVLIRGARQVAGAPVASQAPAGRRGVPDDEVGRFVSRVLGETEDVWSQVLPRGAGRPYEKPVLFSGTTASGCGSAEASMGPFYCPLDRKLYLDTSFFGDMRRRMGGGGEFAYAYVVAHEVGHHVQNLLGLLPRVQAAQRQARGDEDRAAANDLSVRTELMADLLAVHSPELMPRIRTSTSFLARSGQSGLNGTIETPISGRSSPHGSVSPRASAFRTARCTRADTAPWIRALDPWNSLSDPPDTLSSAGRMICLDAT